MRGQNHNGQWRTKFQKVGVKNHQKVKDNGVQIVRLGQKERSLETLIKAVSVEYEGRSQTRKHQEWNWGKNSKQQLYTACSKRYWMTGEVEGRVKSFVLVLFVFLKTRRPTPAYTDKESNLMSVWGEEVWEMGWAEQQEKLKDERRWRLLDHEGLELDNKQQVSLSVMWERREVMIFLWRNQQDPTWKGRRKQAGEGLEEKVRGRRSCWVEHRK